MRVARCIGSVIDVSAITRRYAILPLGNVQRNLQRSLLDATTVNMLRRSASFQGAETEFLNRPNKNVGAGCIPTPPAPQIYAATN